MLSKTEPPCGVQIEELLLKIIPPITKPISKEIITFKTVGLKFIILYSSRH